MIKYLAVLIVGLTQFSAGSLHALDVAELELLTVPVESTEYSSQNRNRLARIAARSPRPRECKQNHTYSNEGVRLSVAPRLNKLSTDRQSEVWKIHEEKRLTREQCLQILVRRVTR